MRGRFPVVTAVVAVMAAALVACGGSPPSGTERTAGQPAPDLTSDVSTESARMLVRVTGTVTAGEAEGCLLLVTPGERYVLLGGDPNVLEPDDDVTVTGYADPAAATPCKEGVPLTVSEVIPVE